MINPDMNTLEEYLRPNYIPEFENAEQFIKAKLKMLEDDFKIILTNAEITHLCELETEADINAAVRTILNNHWR